jgi:hypothetical protein
MRAHTHRNLLRFVVTIWNNRTLHMLRHMYKTYPDIITYESPSSVCWFQLTANFTVVLTVTTEENVTTKTEASVTNALVLQPAGSTRQNSRRQKCNMKQVPLWQPTNIRPHRPKFSLHKLPETRDFSTPGNKPENAIIWKFVPPPPPALVTLNFNRLDWHIPTNALLKIYSNFYI